MRRLVAAIRDNDERKVERAVLQLAGTRKIFAPLALAVGAFVMLFNGLGLPVTSWRLILVEMLPTEWIWAVTVDLKAHALSGRQFHDIREPVVLVLLVMMVCYVAVAARVVGMRPARPTGTAQSGRVAKMARAVVTARIG